MTRRILVGGWWARFTFNGITRNGNGAYSLIGGDELSDSERDELLQLCRHRTPISSSIKVPGSPMRQGPLRVLRGP